MNNKVKKNRKKISRKTKLISASATIGAGVGFAIAGGSITSAYQRRIAGSRLNGNYTRPGGGLITKTQIEDALRLKPSGEFTIIKIGGTDTKYYHVVIPEVVTSTILLDGNMEEGRVYEIDSVKYYKLSGTVYKTTSHSAGDTVADSTGDTVSSLPSGTIYLKSGTYYYTTTKTDSEGYIAEKSGIYLNNNPSHGDAEDSIPNGINYVEHGPNTYALEEMYFVDAFTISNETGVLEPSLRTAANKNTWFTGFTPISGTTVIFDSIDSMANTAKTTTVYYTVKAGTYSIQKTFTITFTKSKREHANDLALSDLNAAKATMDSSLNSKVKTGNTVDSTMDVSEFISFYGTIPNGVTVKSITWKSLKPNKDDKNREATITLSKTNANGTEQIVSFDKNIKFTQSENDKIVSDLEALFASTGSTDLYKDTGTTKLDGTPPATFNASELKTLLEANGITHPDSWNVVIDTAYSSDDDSTEPTIGFHFVAGASSGSVKGSTLHYTRTRKSKAEEEALAILNSVKSAVEAKMTSEVLGYTTQTFGQAEFEAFLGTALDQGVTISVFNMGAAVDNSDIKTRTLTFEIQKTAIDSGDTQKVTITKVVKFEKSSNEEIVDLLMALFGIHGSMLNKDAGSSAIATVPPTLLNGAEIKALLEANQIKLLAGRNWTVTAIQASDLANPDKDKPQIKYQFSAGSHTSTLNTSTLNYSKSRNQSAVDAIVNGDFELSGGLGRIPSDEDKNGFKALGETNGSTPIITNVLWNNFDQHKFIQTANITIKIGTATKTFNNIQFIFTKRLQDTNVFATTAQGITFTPGSTTKDATINIPPSIQKGALNAIGLEMWIATNTAHDNWFQVPAGATYQIPEDKSLFVNGDSKELWVKFISIDTNVILDPGENAAEIADIVKQIKDYIDVAGINLDGITITGDTHAPVFNESGANIHDTRIEIVYSLTNGGPGSDQEAIWMGFPNLAAATSAGFKPWMTKTEIEALFNASHPDRNITYLESTWKTFVITTKIRIKSSLPANNNKDAVLSDPSGKITNALDAKMKALKKWINTSSIIASFDNIKLNLNKHSDNATWVLTGGDSVATIVANAAAWGFEIQYSIKTNAAGDFVKLDPNGQIPSLDKVHVNRKLYIRFVLASDKKGLKASDTLSDTSVKDITALSYIQNVKTRVDTSAFTAISSKIEGWLNNLVTMTDVTAPTGTKIMYSGDNGVTWKSKSDFITWANGNVPKRGEILAKLVTSDANKFVVLGAETREGVITVDDLYSYKDVDSLTDLLNIQNGDTYPGSAKPVSSTGRITFGGTIGVTDGAVFMVTTPLTNSVLLSNGLKLQFTTDETLNTWINADIKASQNVGGINYSNSQLITLNNNTTVEFLALRIVPIKDDEGVQKPPADKNKYADHIESTMVKPSDFKTSKGPHYQVDTTKIPVQIKTDHTELSKITFDGQVRELVINENKLGVTGNQSPQDWLKAFNGGQNDYWYTGTNPDVAKRAITIKYNFKDGIHDSLWLMKDDFIKFLKDGLPIAGEPLTNTAPDWNNIDVNDFTAKWAMIPAKMVTPDNVTPAKVKMETGFKKWIDTTAILSDLRNLLIDGDTWHLTSTQAAAIVARLDALTGGHNFEIIYSNSGSFTLGDTNTQTDKFDKIHMKDSFDLYFRIVAKANVDFLASTTASATSFDPEIQWDHTSKATTFKTWVNVDRHNLAASDNVALSGNTRTLVSSNVKQFILKSKDGNMDASGSTEGVEIVYKLSDAAFAAAGGVGPNNPMLLADFKLFLKTLDHNGQWGAIDILVGYRAKTGYAIPAGMNLVDQRPNIDNLKRYIDVSSLVGQLSTIKVKTTTGFDDNTHYDSAHVEWDMNALLSSIDPNLKSKLQFLIKTTSSKPSVGDSNWQDTLPTTLNDDKTKRYLFIKIVNTGKVGTEDVILSDGTIDASGRVRTIEIHDVSDSSTIKDVLTNIQLGSLDLEKLVVSGTTRIINMDESAMGRTGFLLTHAKLYYYIDGTGVSGPTNMPTTKYLESAFKAYMTANPSTPRTKIRTILVPDAGYSFKPSDWNQFKDDNKRKPVISNLYSWYDVSTFTPLLKLGDSSAGVGISLTGRAASQVVYNLPANLLPAILKASHLKLQWSVDEGHPANSWHDSNTSALPAGAVPGSKDSQNGEIITLVATGSSASGHLAFRLVPFEDDLGNERKPGDNSDYDGFVAATMAKPSDYQVGGLSYSIDTSQIPILVKTESDPLKQISITGHTHRGAVGDLQVKIGPNGIDIAAAIKLANPNATSAQLAEMGAQITLEYSIDDQKSRIWLLKNDFLAYLRTGIHVDKQGVTHNLDYHNIRFNSVQVKWTAIEITPKPVRIYVPSDSTPVLLDSSTLKKWVDVQGILDQLEGTAANDNLELSGDTHALVDTNNEFNKILARLNGIPNPGITDEFDIRVTNKFTNPVTPDFSSSIRNTLPAELNDKYELAFKLMAKNGNANKFFLATAALPALENPSIIWDTSTADSTIKKWVDVSKASLSAVELIGDTKSIDMIVNPDLVSSKDRQMVSASTPGALIGLEVWYRLSGTTQNKVEYNNNAMPENVFREYMNGTLTENGGRVYMPGPQDPAHDITKYGFTTANYKIVHDGSWGSIDVRVGYHAKDGFKIDPNQEVFISDTNTNNPNHADISPNFSALNRYINIQPLLDQKDQIKLDDSKYLDSKNLHFIIGGLLRNFPGPGFLNGIIHYSTKSTRPSVNDSSWTKIIPTEVPDSNRKLWVKFVPSKVGTEDVNLSDGVSGIGGSRTYTSEIYDLTSQVKLGDLSEVPTHISINGLHLEQITVDGETNNIVIADSESETGQRGNALSHAFVGYSITDFNPITLADAIKFGYADIAAANAAGFKAMMTKTEFLLFVNGDGTPAHPKHNILRNSIKARLEADPGYSMVPADKDATVKSITNDDLYSFIEVDNLKRQLLLEGELNGSVKLQGRIGVTDGVVFSLPDEFSEVDLKAINMKLQYTITATTSSTDFDDNSGNDDQYKAFPISATADWQDATLGFIAADATKGFTSVSNGQIITLSKTKNYAFLAFRLVPINDDEGNAKNPADAQKYSSYITATMSKPSDLVSSSQASAPTRNGVFYSINTSKIPTTIFTDADKLGTITFTGDTRHLIINETTDGKPSDGTNDVLDTIKTETGNQDKNGIFNDQFLKEVEVLYTIDKDGSNQEIWLDQQEMEAYLNGQLKISGGKVVFILGGKEVPQLTAVNRAQPNYLELDIADIRAKWAPAKNTGKYSPSQSDERTPRTPTGHDKATSFRKWFDKTPFITDISQSSVDGNTNSYTIDLKTMGGNPSTVLSAAFLTKHGLKIQYSNDGQTWTDAKFNFMAASWNVQVARLLQMRVVPVDTTKIIIGENYGNEGRDNTNTDLLINELEANGDKKFRTYLDVMKSELHDVKTKGSNHELWGYDVNNANDKTGRADLGLLENNMGVKVDDNSERYGQLEIMYLYDGAYYNKADLLAEIDKRLNPSSLANPPADFMPGNIKAKWRVENPKEFVIRATEDQDNLIDTSDLTEWINIFGIQERPTDADHKVNPSLPPFTKFVGSSLTTDMTEHGAGVSLASTFDLTGDLKELTMNWKPGGLIGNAKVDQTILNQHHMKVQFSVVKIPENTLSSVDWKDGWPGKDNSGAQVDAVHRSLWIRFVPTDASKYTLGTSFRSATEREREFVPIKIDTTQVKYSIRLDASKLAGLKFEGTTQKFAVPSNAQAIEDDAYNNMNPSTNPGKPNGPYIKDDDKAAGFAIIAYKVMATRTRGGYIAGNYYEFVNETEVATFYEDIRKGLLNFDTSTLEVAWRIQDNKAGNNQASDERWVHPNVDDLQNFVYTEDVTTLTDSSYEILGNNLKITIGPLQDMKLDPVELKKLGLKIQYNLEIASGSLADAKAKITDWYDWDDIDDNYKKLEKINSHKNVFIRFVPISTKLPDGVTPKYITEGSANEVGQGPVDGRQIVRLDTTQSRVAIVLDPNFMGDFNGLTTTGKTTFRDATHTDGFIMHPGGDVAKDIYNDLKIPQVADTVGVMHDRARYQYSIGELAIPGDPSSEIWSDNLEDVLKDQYGKGFKSLDKDRDLDGLKIRMKVNDLVETEYVLTEPDGTEYTEDQIKMIIDIKPLVQPIYTDVAMHGLPLSSTWRNFANQGRWKPEFSKGSTSKEAIFERFALDGRDLDASGEESIFKLNQNIYFLNDRTKDLDRSLQKWNALAPRHTHFEFQYRENDTTPWSAVRFTTTPPSQMLKTSTNYTGFKVTLVAGDIDQHGNILDDYGNIGTAKYELPAGQEWSREFNIVLIKNTETTEVKKIDFIGFETATGTGIIERETINGDPNLGKPKIVFKDGSGNTITNLFDDKAFTLEYRVTSASGSDISWTDSKGVTKSGWHAFPQAPVEGSGSYPSPYEEFGYPPVSLKNGQRIYIRLRANDGWVINDSSSTDQNTNGFSKWSHQMDYIEVKGLKDEISVPNDVRIFDVNPDFNLDENGQKVAIDPTMPQVSFTGNDGSGTVNITTGTLPDSQNITPETQWLRPWRPKNVSIDLPLTKSDLSPMYGYELIKTDGTTVVVFTTALGHNEDSSKTLGWIDDISMIPDSWYDPANLDKLSVTDSLNIRFVAKDGYAFKWEDDRNFFMTNTKHKPWVDIWVPKEHTEKIYNDNGKFEAYKSIKVNNLLIIPRHKARDVTMGYRARKEYSKPYNEHAYADPNLKPLATDKWVWKYSDTKNGLYNESSRPDYSNGESFWMKAAPRYEGFKLDPSYDNTPIKFIVTGLTNMISTKYIPRPIMDFDGFVGVGFIKGVTPDFDGIKDRPYIKEGGRLDQPDASGDGDVHNGVTWEFQISDINPETMNPLDVAKLPWTQDEPKNLKVGQYIRMRVAARDSVDGVEPPVYSKVEDPNMDAKEGWVKITGLKVDQAKIGFIPVVGGFKGKTIITPKMTMATLDEGGITMEAKIVSRFDGSAVTGKWIELRNLKDLQNGDRISYRAVAKKDFRIDPSQSNAFPAINGDVAYIQKGSWVSIPIESLKDYLNVDQVQLKNILIVRDSRHPNAGDDQYVKQDPNDSTKTVPLDPTDILSGNASISPDGFVGGILDNENDKWANGIDTITDVNGNPVSGGVKIQFVVQKYDPDSATYTEIAPTDKIPFGLKNMDRVKIELVPVNNDKYKLSSERSIWITMKGLVQPSPKLNQPPTLTFMGQNGSGTVVVTPIGQSGFKWVYNVQKIGAPETDIFVTEVPMDLENGDRVRVELASAIAGEDVTITYRTKFLTVSNLVLKFDMSKIKLDNEEKVLQIIGQQEKEAKVHAIAPDSLTSGGLGLEHADHMKWRYRIVHGGEKTVPTHPSQFKNALPEKLVNGDKVYAILVSTNPDIEIIGFKPIVIEIKDLKPESKVSGKMSFMVIAIGGGVLTAGLATVAVFIMRNRKKRML